jgi:HEAT repeat protein
MIVKKQHWLWGLGFLVFVLVSLIACLSYRRAEPSYQGKTASQWLRELKPVVLVGSGGVTAMLVSPPGGGGPAADSGGRRQNAVKAFREMTDALVSPPGGGGPAPDTDNRRQNAIEAFREMGAAAVPPLLRTLGGPHPLWDRIGRFLENNSPKLLNPVRRSFANEAMVRRVAIEQALMAVGPPACPALMEFLDQPRDRDFALSLLIQLRPRGLAPHPALVRLIDDPDQRVRDNAFLVLGLMGASASPAVPRLLKVARGADLRVRCQAIRAMGEIGPSAAGAVPALREWSQDTNALIRMACADSLGKIEPSAASGTVIR